MGKESAEDRPNSLSFRKFAGLHSKQAAQHSAANAGGSSFKGMAGADEVRVKLGDVFPLLIDAVGRDRAWLRDFADDEISVSPDLHDVMQAYRSFIKDAA